MEPAAPVWNWDPFFPCLMGRKFFVHPGAVLRSLACQWLPPLSPWLRNVLNAAAGMNCCTIPTEWGSGHIHSWQMLPALDPVPCILMLKVLFTTVFTIALENEDSQNTIVNLPRSCQEGKKIHFLLWQWWDVGKAAQQPWPARGAEQHFGLPWSFCWQNVFFSWTMKV